MQFICYLGSHLPRFAPMQNNLFKITIKRFILPRCAQHSDPDQTTSSREVSTTAVSSCFRVSTLSQHWALRYHVWNLPTFPSSYGSKNKFFKHTTTNIRDYISVTYQKGNFISLPAALKETSLWNFI